MISIDLKGKTALITGASGMLGRVISKRLAECGADLILCYNSNSKKADELVDSLTKEYGIAAIAKKANIRDLDSIINLRDEIEKEFKLPDILVNSAVSQYEWHNVLDQPIEDYVDQFETTVIHNVNMIKAFVPHMIEQKWGRVIGINSESAMLCGATSSAYVAGKRGMDGIYRVLPKELGNCGVTVNQIAPGWTITDRERENGTKDPTGEFAALVPMGYRGDEMNIANAVVFFASELSSFITGTYLPVCGGHVLPGI